MASAVSRRPALAKLSNVVIADRGFRAKVTSTSITLTGTARGPRTANLLGEARGSEYERVQTIRSGIGLDFDRDRMPAFDTSRGYTEKNAWVFAHSASISTKAGQTPKHALDALAKVLRASHAVPRVVVHRDGSATLTLERS